jgi:hypothetical protein
MEATEREHTLRALRESQGQIGGLKRGSHAVGIEADNAAIEAAAFWN